VFVSGTWHPGTCTATAMPAFNIRVRMSWRAGEQPAFFFLLFFFFSSNHSNLLWRCLRWFNMNELLNFFLFFYLYFSFLENFRCLLMCFFFFFFVNRPEPMPQGMLRDSAQQVHVYFYWTVVFLSSVVFVLLSPSHYYLYRFLRR
jgi:hypothetical protein